MHPQSTSTPGDPPDTPNSAHLTLNEASALTGVPYDTLVTATRAQRLATHRDPEVYRNSVTVHIVELIIYMQHHASDGRRWRQTNVPVSAIFLRPELQPRVEHSRTVINELSTHIRRGGAVEPVWLIPDQQGHLQLVDGHRRLAATKECQRAEIPAIILPIPPAYGVAIARAVNQRNGERLSGSCTRKIVADYLVTHPEVLAQIAQDTLTQAALARMLDVSEAAVSRAIKSLGKGQPEQPDMQMRSILLDLRKALEHLGHEDPNDAPVIMWVLNRVSNAFVGTWTKEQKRDIDERFRHATAAVSRAFPPAVRALACRRGGDRRRNSGQGGTPCKS